MRNKRKYSASLLISLLFICVLQISIVSAAASPFLSASADTADVAKGSYVNISVNLNGNPSISTLGVALSYDSIVLKYDSTSWDSGFSGSDMKMASDTGSEVNLSIVCDDRYSADGTIATVRFKAVQDFSSIPVILSLKDMADVDLSAVSNCKVYNQVQVPETSGSKDDTADKKDDMVQLKASADDEQTENGAGSDEPLAVSVTGTDTESVKSSSNASAGNTQESSLTAGGRVQSASVQNVQDSAVSNTSSVKPDHNYKTGAGLGNDIFLVLAAACGVLALVLVIRRRGEE